MGNEQEAVAIRVERRRKQSLFTRRYEPVSDDPMARAMRYLVNIWNFVQGALVDYGYRPGKAILFLLALIVIGAGIFQYAALQGVMTPTHPLIYKEAAGGFIPTACSKNWVYPDKSIKSACEKAIPGEYSTFNALMYSADLALPIVDFRMQSDWSPRVVTWPDGKWPNTAWPFPATLGGWVRLWEWAQVILGWVLSLLFVSAVGGIIRR